MLLKRLWSIILESWPKTRVLDTRVPPCPVFCTVNIQQLIVQRGSLAHLYCTYRRIKLEEKTKRYHKFRKLEEKTKQYHKFGNTLRTTYRHKKALESQSVLQALQIGQGIQALDNPFQTLKTIVVGVFILGEALLLSPFFFMANFQ